MDEQEKAAVEALSAVLVALDAALAACIRAGYGSEVTQALEAARQQADHAWVLARD